MSASAGAQSACTTITDGAKRLACFDSVSAPPPAPTAEATARRKAYVDSLLAALKGKTFGTWSVSESVDAIDDSKKVAAITESAERLGIGGQRASLMFRCSQGRLTAYVDWNSYLADNARVVMRLGTEPAKSIQWTSSSDKTATFWRSDERAFADTLMKHTRMVVQIAPYQKGPVTASFDLTGVREALPMVLDACPKK